jgi:hypothetical protein
MIDDATAIALTRRSCQYLLAHCWAKINATTKDFPKDIFLGNP